MRKLLVTGGAGFIGGNFVRYWRKHYPADEITVLDALTYAGNRTTVAGISDIDFRHGDIRDEYLCRELLRERSIDTIVHFAAETHVDRSITGPEVFVATNVVGTQALLEAARQEWLVGSGRPHRFHHVSTDEVYGTLEPGDDPSTELSPIVPNSPYAASKAASDHFVRAYWRTYGLDAVITRCSNNYGPLQYPEKLLPRFLLAALHGQVLPLYGDGMQVRDWLYVDDHCHGIEASLSRGKAGQVFNLGGMAGLPNIEVAEILCRTIDDAFENDPSLAERFPDTPAARGAKSIDLIEHVEDRPGHDRRYAVDDTLARQAIGYRPATDFAEGLKQTVVWYLANEAWWKSLLKE